MGWGIAYTADMYISREHFDDITQVEDKINETKEQIEFYRQKMLMICMGGKDSFDLLDCEDNRMDAVDVVQNRVNEILDYMFELNDNLFKYELLRDNFGTRDNV